MDIQAKKIISGSVDEVKDALKEFNENNASTFSFKELDQNNLRCDLWNAIFKYLADDGLSELHVACLMSIRILSRDKTDLDQLLNKERIELLLDHAKLKTIDELEFVENETAVEALKCLCNVIFNSLVAATICSKNQCVGAIMNRCKQYKNPKFPNTIKVFDMKVLFLISALCEEVRPKLRENMHGLTYLIELLEETISKYSHNSDINQISADIILLDSDVDLICEVLKVLFNITIHTDYSADVDEEDEAHYNRLIGVLYGLLIVKLENDSKQIDLHNHIINLLTNMPIKCYQSLFMPLQDNEVVPKNMQYEEQNMNAINSLITFLESRFSSDGTIRNQQELLSPILTVLVKAVNSSRIIRKYLRLKILPPLRDVHNRPEQGDTLRNSLCRLLTTPLTNVRDLSADLLFVLCKENVGRMIKYTGYGNAAGLFAQRGLLGGGRPDEGRYSSDSEDSDTDEYREFKHGINPVIGCYEPPHTSPIASMTEEQKEYEAMKLVDLMDNLTRQGIVQPCRIGEDGRPEPIEHVLQLQESLPNDQANIIRDNKS
ncbi:hypothetical protein RN001_003583 [Aquatica leii]|uniref:Synembryn-A n=1 Tax=Aquatica leii TaxID=1421715 RepID=A0AAN7SKV3_9COLE|nr:hypothetical protein RN001_003583 [Aquatica leii]